MNYPLKHHVEAITVIITIIRRSVNGLINQVERKLRKPKFVMKEVFLVRKRMELLLIQMLQNQRILELELTLETDQVRQDKVVMPIITELVIALIIRVIKVIQIRVLILGLNQFQKEK